MPKKLNENRSIFKRIENSMYSVTIQNSSNSKNRRIQLGKDIITIPRLNDRTLFFNDIVIIDERILQLVKVNHFFYQGINYNRWKK